MPNVNEHPEAKPCYKHAVHRCDCRRCEGTENLRSVLKHEPMRCPGYSKEKKHSG